MNERSDWTQLLGLSTSPSKVPPLRKPALTPLTSTLEKSTSRLVSKMWPVPPCVVADRRRRTAAQTPLTQYFLQQGVRMYAFASHPQLHDVRR